MGRRLIYDLESNGLLEEVTRIWCIGTLDIDTGEERLFTPLEIEEGLQYLQDASLLIAHNGIRYDNEVFKKLHNVDMAGKTLDTLIMSKIHSPFLTGIKGVTNKPYSLQAFGHMFKFPKGDHTDWSQYTPEMGEYCLQDCRVTLKIWEWLLKEGYEWDSPWNRIEHDFAALQQKAVNKGVWFDENLQRKTLFEIKDRMETIQDSVSDILGYAYEPFDYNLKAETTKGNPTHRTLEERLTHHALKKLAQAKLEFPWYDKEPIYNKSKTKVRVKYPVKITLDTKKFLIQKLQQLGWCPEFYTDPSDTHPEGQPQLVRDGEVDPNLAKMSDEYKEFSEYFMLKHRYGLINGFTKYVRDGRIPSDGDTVGAVTGRVTHRGIANFPAVRTPYGEVIRAMFGVEPKKNKVFMGSDLAGIEARLLAHYMNDSDFTEEVLNGDIHSKNQQAAGLPTRDDAKTFFYAFMYGAGDGKIGSIINGSSKDGKRIKSEFLSNLPSLANVINEKQKEGEQGFITAIGGRPIKLTYSKGYDGEMGYDTRKALNSLLQGSGAIYFKKWALEVDKRLKGDDTIVILYHDEVQIDNSKDTVEYTKQALEDAVLATDAFFQVNCPNAIETKTGANWKETH
jgi:DNA polymerase I-like protein with 3'-5' exonuclease and polymerase domains